MSISQYHVSFSQLADHMEGRLAPDEQIQVENHIASCSQCAGEMARLRRVLGFLQIGEDAPGSVIQHAVDLFQERTAPNFTLSELRRRVIAILHFDSGGLAPVFGVRSGKPGSRQLLFSTPVDEIDLRIETQGEGWLVSGQILGESTGAGMAVLEGAADACETAINECSEFSLPTVQAGTYTLLLSLPNGDVEINDLRVGL